MNDGNGNTAASADAAAQLQSQSPSQSPSESQTQPMTLLFVDDEPGILSALRRLFRIHGYRIFTAESGAQGLEILEREPVDLVISDMRMPIMDGARFLRQVRERWPQCMRILLTGYADMASTIEAINQGEIYRYVSKPWDDDEIAKTVHDALEFKRLSSENIRLNKIVLSQNEELKNLNAGLEKMVAARTEELRQAMGFLEQANAELKQTFMATVRVFSGLLELRGGKLVGHSRRVAELARDIACRMGLDEATVHDIVIAGLVHDVGKISLPDELLNHPFNTLSADMRAKVVKHSVIGENAIMCIKQLKGVALLVRHHHECYDGSGYPDGLVGLAIPLGARILMVANDYENLHDGLLLSRTLSKPEALAYIVDNRGKRYDPAVVDALSAILAQILPDQAPDLTARPGSVKIGMVLTQDLMHRDGYMLLARGQVIDANIKEQLVRLEKIDGEPMTLHVRN